uniref:Temptin Cys/Cys disulfide domain-containing protein n=1 Tax=Globisporangium ultimum (strain ATCC 200006 / CBS 805.95 / DAOM BR144) TaxID=431595 RepID=K3X0X1_GLOUD
MRNALIALVVLLLVSMASGSPAYRSRIPNGFNVPNVLAVGHSDSQGNSDSLNAFGKAFDKAGKKWTVALCQADSDGDGQTNGQELGDPCCVWATGGTPLRVSGLSDPGIKASMSDPTLWSSQNCTMTSSSTNSTISTSAAPQRTYAIATTAFTAGLAIATLFVMY